MYADCLSDVLFGINEVLLPTKHWSDPNIKLKPIIDFLSPVSLQISWKNCCFFFNFFAFDLIACWKSFFFKLHAHRLQRILCLRFSELRCAGWCNQIRTHYITELGDKNSSSKLIKFMLKIVNTMTLCKTHKMLSRLRSSQQCWVFGNFPSFVFFFRSTKNLLAEECKV